MIYLVVFTLYDTWKNQFSSASILMYAIDEEDNSIIASATLEVAPHYTVVKSQIAELTDDIIVTIADIAKKRGLI